MSALGSLLPTVGAVAGTAIGGPIGGMIGNQIGSLVGSELDKNNGNCDVKGSPSSGVADRGRQRTESPWDAGPGLEWAGGLTSNGRDCVDTGRYMITVAEGEVRLFDKENNTWVRVWGDPHVQTSDGDKASFTENNLTFDLPDGTKVTLQPTQVENGVSYLDKIAIIKGTEAVEISGLDPRDSSAVKVGNVLNNGDFVDAKYDDGSVVRAGKQIDDLVRAGDGSEIVGGDPNGRWNEWNLDNAGGTSQNGFPAQDSQGSGPTGNTGATGGTGSASDSDESMGADWKKIASMIASGASIADILMMIAGQLEKTARKQLESYQSLADRYDKQSQADAAAAASGQKPDTSGNRINESDMKTATQQLQRIQELIQQLSQTASNIQKAYHDSNMTTVANLK